MGPVQARGAIRNNLYKKLPILPQPLYTIPPFLFQAVLLLEYYSFFIVLLTSIINADVHIVKF